MSPKNTYGHMNYKSCRNNILLLWCRSSNRRLIGKIGMKSCSLTLAWCGQAQLDPMLRDRVAGRAWHFLDGMDFGLHCGRKPKSHKQPEDTTSPGISCLSEIKKRKGTENQYVKQWLLQNERPPELVQFIKANY